MINHEGEVERTKLVKNQVNKSKVCGYWIGGFESKSA